MKAVAVLFLFLFMMKPNVSAQTVVTPQIVDSALSVYERNTWKFFEMDPKNPTKGAKGGSEVTELFTRSLFIKTIHSVVRENIRKMITRKDVIEGTELVSILNREYTERFKDLPLPKKF